MDDSATGRDLPAGAYVLAEWHSTQLRTLAWVMPDETTPRQGAMHAERVQRQNFAVATDQHAAGRIGYRHAARVPDGVTDARSSTGLQKHRHVPAPITVGHARTSGGEEARHPCRAVGASIR